MDIEKRSFAGSSQQVMEATAQAYTDKIAPLLSSPDPNISRKARMALAIQVSIITCFVDELHRIESHEQNDAAAEVWATMTPIIAASVLSCAATSLAGVSMDQVAVAEAAHKIVEEIFIPHFSEAARSVLDSIISGAGSDYSVIGTKA